MFIFVSKTTKNMGNNFSDLHYDSVAVAKAIRYSAKQNGFNVNMTQINKLLYILYGTILVEKKQRLTTEHPSAWPYGPVFPCVHKRIKLSDEIDGKDYEEIRAKSPFIADRLDQVVKTFGKIPAGQLSEWSHAEGSPWLSAVHRSNGKWNTPLNDEDIYNYFFSYLNVAA